MIDMFVGTDHQSYAKESISQWLTQYSISPSTREYMETHFLSEDHTMMKVITAINYYKIIYELNENICENSSESKEIVPVSIPHVSTPYIS